MNGLTLCLLLALLLVLGCASNARLREERAFRQGQAQALTEQQQQIQPSVRFQGDVRQTRIPWTEGLTLSQALLTAQYTWSWDPRTITVTRQGQLYSVNPKRLFRGEDNPVLEPDDVVEVRH